MAEPDPRSLPELVSSLVSGLADLLRKESALLRAEVDEKIGRARRAGVRLAIGGALLLGAFLALLQALVLALSKAVDPVWAAVIVGLAVGLVGYLLVRSAARMIQPAAMTPDRSKRQLGKTLDLAKGPIS